MKAMDSFIEYIIKSGVSLIVFYLFYWLILRNDTHFRLNRLVLLFSMIISLVLPLIDLEVFRLDRFRGPLPPFVIHFSETAVTPDQIVVPAPVHAMSIWKIILLIYLTGVAIACARLIYQAIYLQAVSRLSDKHSRKGYTIVSTNTDMMPFSYFKRIFLPTSKIDDSSMNSIIAHEKSHMMQYHYMDLFMTEAIAIFQWFNPVVWLYERSLKEIHEYLADEAVINTGENRGKYQAILVNEALGGPVFVFTNQFNQSLIKKRITMMNKLKSSPLAQLKALLVVPLIAGLLLAFANPQTSAQASTEGKPITVKGQVTVKSSGEGLPGSAVIIKGTTTGTLTDRNGDYALEVNDRNASLIFSCVGFQTEEVPIGNNTKINVELQEDVLTLDFTHGNKMQSLNDQEHMPQKENAGNEKMYVMVEDNPTYPGGTDALLKFLQDNIRYPEAAKRDGISGIVLVQYTIDGKGVVKNAKVMRGVSPELDEEALRVTNLITGWQPARQNGKAITRVVSMPVTFVLP
jgi:TonB family protein